MKSEELMAQIMMTVTAMDAKGLINDYDSTSVPFSLHYHAGNDRWGKGWYASIPWNDDKESDIFDTIAGAIEWVYGELSCILEEARK